MRILVTGGAGFIGSHTVRELINAGHSVTVLDNLSKGHEEAVDPRATLIVGSISNLDLLTRCLNSHQIEAVMHFAGHADVGESIHEPYKYYLTNASFTLILLHAMVKAGVKKIIYSSSGAIYGNPDKNLIAEDEYPRPITPYGRSKLMAEQTIQDFSSAYGLGHIILRYFNVAGASPDVTIGEDHHPETHLIPRLLHAAQDEGTVDILISNFSTPDGTAVRDYLHVVDVARAHLLALEKVQPERGETYNLGSEAGFSVREVISACESVVRKKINTRELKRTPHEPARLVLDSKKIRSQLKWLPLYPSIQTIAQHSWLWHSTHPHGYPVPDVHHQNQSM